MPRPGVPNAVDFYESLASTAAIEGIKVGLVKGVTLEGKRAMSERRAGVRVDVGQASSKDGIIQCRAATKSSMRLALARGLFLHVDMLVSLPRRLLQ